MSSVGRASIDLTVNQQAAQRELQALGGTIVNWGRRLSRIMLPIFAGLTGIQAFRAAIEQEDSIFRLEQAYERLGVSVGEAMARSMEFAGVMQNELGVAGGDVINLMRDIVQQSRLTGAELETMTRAALGLAQAYRIDTSTALRMLTRVQQDANFNLDRYGIILDDTLTGQERFNALIQQGIDGLDEMRQRGDTLAGSWQRLKVEMGNLAEESLMPMLPLITRMVRGMTQMAQAISNHLIPAVTTFGDQWRQVMGEMLGSGQTVFEPLTRMINNFGETVSRIALSIRVVISNAIDSATVQILRLGVALDDLIQAMGGRLFPEGWAEQAGKDIDELLNRMENRSHDILSEFTRMREQFNEMAFPAIAGMAGAGRGGTGQDLTGSYSPQAFQHAMQMSLLKRDGDLERQLNIMRRQLELQERNEKLNMQGQRLLEQIRDALTQFQFGFQ